MGCRPLAGSGVYRTVLLLKPKLQERVFARRGCKGMQRGCRAGYCVPLTAFIRLLNQVTLCLQVPKLLAAYAELCQLCSLCYCTTVCCSCTAAGNPRNYAWTLHIMRILHLQQLATEAAGQCATNSVEPIHVLSSSVAQHLFSFTLRPGLQHKKQVTQRQ
jgi:hypothetical protein